MAFSKSSNKRVKLLAAVICVSFGFVLLWIPGSHSRERVRRHFLSWESSQRPHEYRRMMRHKIGLRRFKVSKDRIAKLKTSSILNKRPYQFATPIIEDGRLYVGVDAGRFYAFDISRGDMVWEFQTEGPVQGKAALGDDTVYFGDSKAFVYAIDKNTGVERWRSKLDAEALATPLVAGTRLYAADMSGRLYAIDRADGEAIWHTDPNDRGVGFSVRRASAPRIFGDLILLGTSTGAMIAFRTADGSIAWVRQLGARQSQVYDVDSTPLVIGDRVYAASADGATFCLEAPTGRVVWSQDVGGANDILYNNGRLYVSGQGVLSQVDPSNGEIYWQQDLETPEVSSPVAGENLVAVVSTTTKLYLIDSETGDVVYERFIGKGSLGDPQSFGNDLYLLSNTSRLYSFNVREIPPRKRK